MGTVFKLVLIDHRTVMEKAAGWKRQWGLFVLLIVQLFFIVEASGATPVRGPGSINSRELKSSLPPLRLHRLGHDYVVMDNGIVMVTLSTPKGLVTRIQYQGIDNILEYNKETNRGYWDILWTTTRERVLDGFVMLRGSSGFYTYSIFERLEGFPAMTIDQGRVAFKLQHKLFNYMAISDTRQRVMPTPYDRSNGQPLDYHEAVVLTNPSNPQLKGEVFFSNHYAGRTMSLEFQDGEPWKKVFGPVFIYLNSDSANKDPSSLWEDAKKQSVRETESWPYDFPLSEDFPTAKQRGTVTGRLLVHDRYINRNLINANSAYGYQFWTRADAEGHFVIKGIRPGNYSLYAWAPGIIGDYRYDNFINIAPGGEIRVGNLVYYPPRVGPTLWEIGVPDRTAAEFFVPDPDSKRVNNLYTDHADRFRQYGLWDRYSDLYPNHDLIFNVGTSSYQKNWFFAHVTRKQNNTYVRVNNPRAAYPHFTTRLIGRDNAIARHGIHGLYSLYSVDISSLQLVKGSNSIYLTQSRGGSPFNGLMYDYLRLEGPPYAS
ncbi:hypothetical protein RHGRI_030141 [Rhododendron griersonianum]|uniref:Rhamnogalacturonan endolyase n=1 Tax=Rhododendron griersonianum TaxID=479676 RepID=A0AAV6IP08_9ERIC|nr:hypothetical protein RHGRI_030141 [Rhododendron griersonianum]KAG5529660.1 hypothetical protein RHGRI_030141 [Rhododendron griersonianum]KAG5529661.1 hypothetical protein RHGRI_030141 [Rhododendron griersonianum]